MSTTVVISSKGQVVVPASWRKELGLLPGKLAQVVKTGVGVLVKPVAKDPIESCFGKLAGTDLISVLRKSREQDLKHEEKLLKLEK